MDFDDENDRDSIDNQGPDDNFLNIQTAPHIVDPDEEFEGECCFWLMKSLRGNNVGRRLKRKIFKYSLLSFLIGFPLFCITAYEGETKFFIFIL